MTRCTSIDSNSAFDWPLAYEAEGVLRRFIGLFLERNQFANEVSKRMSEETGTDFYDWVDYLTADTSAIDELLRVGFVLEQVDALPGCAVYYHPRAMMPRVIVHQKGSLNGAPRDLALRPESIVDFVSRNSISTDIRGQFGSRLRTVRVAEESGHRLFALERLAYRGFVEQSDSSEFAFRVMTARELWRTRRRDFANDASGIAHAFEAQEKVIALVGVDVACDLFFAEERAYWELKGLVEPSEAGASKP